MANATEKHVKKGHRKRIESTDINDPVVSCIR